MPKTGVMTFGRFPRNRQRLLVIDASVTLEYVSKAECVYIEVCLYSSDWFA